MMNFKVEPFSVLSASSCIVQGDINSESSKEEFSNWESEHVELECIFSDLGNASLEPLLPRRRFGYRRIGKS